MTPVTPPRLDLVLVGGGHSHVAVLRMFGMRPEPGVRLTVVAKELDAPYSGMLPGLVAGTYRPEECHIDLVRLAAFAGARLIQGEAEGIDRHARRLSIRGRPPLSYDLLSLDVGITPALDSIAGAASHALAVKPVSTFWPRWRAMAEAALKPDGPRRFAVVGGGAAGFELVLAIRAGLRQGAAARGLDPDDFHFTLVAGERLLPGFAAGAQRHARAALGRAGVALSEQAAGSVEPGRLLLADGSALDIHAALVTTRASAPAWLRETGLDLDSAGFLALRPTLQSTGDDAVFAAGDCASVLAHPRPKAGVFAVRQGPVLSGNLRRVARGEPPEPFAPQRRFLTLLSTADGRAIAARGRLAAEGGWVWRWKDRIDRRFMAKYNALPTMARDAEPMRCGGCAAKLGPATLAAALDRLGGGAGPRDDAAVIETGGDLLRLETVDFFRAFWADPYVLGEIAAHHALGDVLAMGGTPETALAICVAPYAAPRLAGEDLFQLLAGARAAFDGAGVRLVGGHSSEGAELAVGFAVTGTVARDRVLRKSGLRPGDSLVLTRPIGTGVLFAAAMRGVARAADVAAALAEMRRPQAAAAGILLRHGATAATDVTGFGLAGHLIEMLEASGVAATLDPATVPLHAGALELASSGIASTLLPENLALADRSGGAASPADLALLFDPQTAGGLLAGLPAAAAEPCVAALRADGHSAAIIGRVLAPGAGPPLRIMGRFG